MSGAQTCKRCGIPTRTSKSLTWNSNGTITEARNPDHRMVFADVDGMGELFANIEGLIGISIQSIITESKAKATGDFTKELIRGWKGAVVRRAGLGIVINKMGGVAKSFGYGDIDIIEVDWKQNKIDFRLHDPYSVPLMCGDLRGATEAVKDVVGTVEPEQEDEHTWIVRGRLSPPPSGMEERLAAAPVRLKPGDLAYECCSSCGVPLGISGFDWDVDRGIIRNQETGVRYAFVGPGGIQAIFDELASELGESIPETVIEAQRMRVASQDFDAWKKFGAGEFRELLAALGFGNMISFEASDGTYSATIENAALSLMIVGTALGALEAITGKKATAEWSLDPDGDLQISVREA
jgi:hypothetical protein